jgi:integrase
MTGGVAVACSRHHRKADGRCSSRCLRYYPFLEGPSRPDGRRSRQSLGAYPTRKAAAVALREELGHRDQGIVLDPAKVTLAQAAERALDHLAALGRDEKTLERYHELVSLHVLPTLGGLPLRQLQPAHLDALYARLLREGRRDGRPGGLHPRTVGHVHRVVHRVLKQAVRWRLLSVNPAADLELPTVPSSEMVTLDREQAGRLLEAAERRPLMRWLVLLGLATGARLGELLALRWADVDLDAGTVRIGHSRRNLKGRRQPDGSRTEGRMQVKGPKSEAGVRTVAPDPAVVAALRRLRAEQATRRLALGPAYSDEDLVICRPDGRPYRPDSVSTMFRKFVDDLGLPRTIHTHTLRHSAASFLAAAGVPASDIAAQLGHKDGGQLALKVYVHPMAEGLARAGRVLGQVLDGGEQ